MIINQARASEVLVLLIARSLGSVNPFDQFLMRITSIQVILVVTLSDTAWAECQSNRALTTALATTGPNTRNVRSCTR